MIQSNTGGASAIEFFPLPHRGSDSVFGLSRSTYYNLEKIGAIRFVRVRRPGNRQGRTLVNCASVRNYFARLERQQYAGRGEARNAESAAETITAASPADEEAAINNGKDTAQ